MRILIIAILAFSLSGCYLYASMGLHNKSEDSEYKEENFLTTFGAAQELNDNFEFYFEHTSMPFYLESLKEEDAGWGVNEIGARAKVKIF